MKKSTGVVQDSCLSFKTAGWSADRLVRNLFAAIFAASFVFAFASCKTETETEYVTVPKPTYLTATTSDATTIRHYTSTNTAQASFAFSLKETEYKDVPSGTALSEIAKEYAHFHAVGLKHDEGNPQVVIVYYTYDFVTVTFDYDGGTSETSGDAATYSFTDYFSASLTAPQNPAKEGYHFDYWTLDDEETEISSSAKFTENVTYKAHWHEIVYYTVAYTSDYGTKSGSFKWPCHTRLSHKLDNVTEGGKTYYFYRWCSDSAFTTALTVTVLAKDVDAAYAKWVTEDVPTGFVRVQGTTVDGTATLTPSSKVFISGRSIKIGDLYVCDHEVTQAEYETYCIYGGSRPGIYGKGDNYPAYYVSWYDAVVYCNLRSIAENLTPVYKIGDETDPSKWNGVVGKNKYCGPSDSSTAWNGVTFDTNANGYRLPTETEWEYVARGENKDSYTYSGSDTADDVAWCKSNSDGTTYEVKTKQANSLGIHDMSGNVREWCYDRYSSSITKDTPATGTTSGSTRSTRGGSPFEPSDSRCSVDDRSSQNPNVRDCRYGFRVVRNANN